ncbi:SpoIIIAH-like family protein [Paenibacillus sp. 1P07SE]|uniref:SpoIIIAH-like family protein n=1 Tax=Paenibacillus sp. 1P07SE TaxID=3132209 RepID=UPI0039A46199
MNTKRQTIWLVSMLSLMVILSAYYLFTEDSTPTDHLTDAGGITDIVLGDGAKEAAAGGGTEGAMEEIIVTDVERLGDQESSSAPDDAGPTDQEVLSMLKEQEASAAASDYFAQQQYLRAETLREDVDRLYSIVTDMSQSPETASEAMIQLEGIQQEDEKITGLEEELSSEFSKVAITPEQDKYKVVVQSQNLERSQAASIIDKVMRTLDISAEHVSVQFIQ